ncbi:MAG: hypothetical protein ACI9C4_001153, partial [Paraglaciecola sp.]
FTYPCINVKISVTLIFKGLADIRPIINMGWAPGCY